MEETIELRELLEIIVKRKWIIIAFTTISILLGGIYSFFMITPIYQSETTLMVNSSKGMSAGDIAASFDLGSINMSQEIVVTYGEIVKSRIVLEQVIEKLNMQETYEEMLLEITSAPVGTTEILKITVQNEDPEQAALVANTISSVFVKEVMRILKVDNVETIDKAISIDKPINVKKALNIAISAILGLMLGVFIAFALEYMDNTIKSPEDIEKHLGIHVLGAIPDFSQAVEKNTGGA